MIEYAAGDVTSLIPEVYETQKRYYKKTRFRGTQKYTLQNDN
jgi:hypothetical protein